ncbi:YaiI/YqxD family protein [uncultured Thioclava sp.]|uniref:YaiI/YqxD family protein n=1 Tax=uncultured Thioclava sp. TaxID=473858 RepID=UPI0025CE812C|nr:YaiI/YqxD family protein [uncultured Thioclava sp.]
MAVIWIDADACPVKAEAETVATRLKVKLILVSNGGLRPSPNPLVEMVYVDQGPDIADMYIAERATVGDVVVTNDIPLAAKCVDAGARVLRPDGEALTPANIGNVLATRDLMTDLRSADPFRQGGGKPFSKADRSRFADALDRITRAAMREANNG